MSQLKHRSIRGSVVSPAINETIKTILKLMSSSNWMIKAQFLPGSLNVAADGLSRSNLFIPDESCLAKDTFLRVCKLAKVVPVVDLFATRDTAQLPSYYSSLQDEKSLGLDAFTGDWGKLGVAYAFPPERLLLRLLYKLESSGRGTLIVVAPVRPSASWFPAIINLALWSFPVPQSPRGLYIGRLQEKDYLPTPLKTLRVYVLTAQHK